MKKQQLNDYLLAFSNAHGKRVFEHLEQCFGRRSSFVAGDSHATAFREGQRAVFEFIRSMMLAAQNPDLAETLEEEET